MKVDRITRHADMGPAETGLRLLCFYASAVNGSEAGKAR